jgi:hypothetical protein
VSVASDAGTKHASPAETGRCACTVDQVCLLVGGQTTCAASCTTSATCPSGTCCQPLSALDSGTFNGAGACLETPSTPAGGQCLCKSSGECYFGGTCTLVGSYSVCQ